jgi:DNA polymerase
MAKAVRRDKHDMIAYVRFRQPGDAADVNQTRQADQTHQTHDRPDYLAEFAPEHDVLAWAADYFAERMGKASWVISTPDAVAMSDGSSLSVISKPNSLLRADDAYGNGSGNIAVGPSVPPAQEAVKQAQISEWSLDAESLWLIYYRSTFNPARVDRRGLEQRMPVRHWRGLPEAVLIPGMLSAAHSGQRALAQSHQIGVMPGKSVLIDPAQAQPRRDPSSTLDQCRRCELWRTATQVVPGCGPRTARIMLIGEQPGDQEDLAGRPFVGPAGKLLDSAMQDAGLSRDTVYMTNAVKHFKWEPKGKRRIHKTPQQREIEACRGWLEEELATVQPAVVVALGASALSSIHRSLNRAPGMLGNGVLLATRHPAYALRQADPEAKLAIFNEIAETLRAAVRHCEGLD